MSTVVDRYGSPGDKDRFYLFESAKYGVTYDAMFTDDTTGQWQLLLGLGCTGGFRGALNWAPLMPRDASLSDSYAVV